MASPQKTFRSAFTLIELLVVLGIMALFVGVFATALRPGSPTVAVEGAQAQLASLLTQARGVALLKNSPSRLIINTNSANPDRYLRFAGIVYDDDPDPNAEDWQAATDGITLPQMTYAYTDGPANMEQNFNLAYISNSSENYAYIEFNENGTVSPIGGESPRLAVASGAPGPDGTGVEHDDTNVMGAIIRQYGSFVLLNEPDAFPDPPDEE